MNSTITEETDHAPQTAAGEQPKASKKAKGSPHRTPVAPEKGKAGNKAEASKKAPQGVPKAKRAAKPKESQKESHEGSNASTTLELRRRPAGLPLRN